MRVLWLSPWMRPLARVYVDALHADGHDCRLVTSDQHYQKVSPREYERVLDPRPKDPRTTGPLLRVHAELRRWRPDVVVAELVWDPRWLLLARLAPLVHLVHDDGPHDATENRPAWQRALFERFNRRAAAVVTFSAHVAGQLSHPARVVPLTSDVAEAELPENPARRKNFVLYGRMSPYKNVPVALAAWRRHLDSPEYRGDRLLLLGDGPADIDHQMLPPACEWRRERYDYAAVLPVLAGAKASLVHYRQATQSGVQLLSMQLGVTPIVSDSGGLPEFQPPGEPAVGVDDVIGLAGLLGQLADQVAAVERGAATRAHYLRRYAAGHSAAELVKVLAEVGR